MECPSFRGRSVGMAGAHSQVLGDRVIDAIAVGVGFASGGHAALIVTESRDRLSRSGSPSRARKQLPLCGLAPRQFRTRKRAPGLIGMSGVLVNGLRRRYLRLTGLMNIQARRVGRSEKLLRAFDFRGSTSRHDEEAVGLQVGFVLEHAVLRYAQTVERGPQGAQTAYNDGVFEAGDDDGGKISEHDDVPHQRYRHEQPAEEKPPESAPKSAAGAPELDAVAHIVEADDLLVGVIALADYAEILHLEPRRAQGFHRSFRGIVGREHGNCRFKFFHEESPLERGDDEQTGRLPDRRLMTIAELANR